MDLVKIGFQINANGLKDANKEVDKLLGKVDNIGTKGKKASSDFESSQKKIRDSSQQVTKEVDKTSKALEKQRLIGDYLGKGLDKTTASAIASFKQLGATSSQTNGFIESLLNNKGLEQTRKDLAQLGKEQQKQQEQQAKLVQDTVTQYEKLSNKSLGGGILDSIEQQNKGLEELKKQYRSQEKEQQKALDDIETARQKHFSKVQKDYEKQQQAIVDTQQKAIDKQIKAQNTLNESNQKAITLEQAKAKYVSQGYGKTDSTRLARLEVSGADVTTLNNYKSAIEATTRATQALNPTIEKATTSHNKFLDQVKGIAIYAALSAAIYGVMTAMTSLAVATIKMADEYTAIQNRMKLYITDAKELGKVNSQLAQFSIENNVGLRETATLFSRLAPSMQKLGANTAAITTVVDAFGKSMRIGGATAMEAASATIQFSQAMASGKLAGDEFRSISEASPRFLQAIAEGSGIAASKLKEMSAAGMLTTEVISKALLKEYPKLIEENKKLGITLEQGANAIKTGFLVAIGEFNEGANVTQYFGEMMLDLAQNMFKAAQGAREFGQDVKQWFTDNANTINLVVEAFKVLATVIITRYVVAMGLAVRESIRYQATLVTMAAQQANVTRSSLIMSSAITSVGAAMRGALAFFGGWVGLALTVASATAAYLSFNNASGTTAESFRQEGEDLTTTITKYKELAKVKQQAILDKEIANLEELNKQYDENRTKLVTNVLNLSRHNDMTKAQAKSMSDLALSYKNGDISLEQLVSTVSKSGYVSNDSKVKTRGFAEAVVDAGEKAGLSKDLINAMRKVLADSGETAKISKTGVDTFTKGLEDQAKKLREITALANKYGLEIASAAKLQEQLSSRFGARETELPLKKQYYDKKAQAAMARGDTTTANNWEKASIAVQSQQNALLKEKNQLIGDSVKKLKDVELAQKEQSDYTESLRKAEKGSEKVGNTREKDRKKYQDQAKELSTYITLLEEAQDVDIARIASEKEYQNAFGASLDQAKALYELSRQSEQVEARAVFIKNLAEEEEAQGRINALLKIGATYEQAKTLAESKFTDNAQGRSALEQMITNDLFNQNQQLDDMISQQASVNGYLAKGMSLENATMEVTKARLQLIKGGALSEEQKSLAEAVTQQQLKLKAYEKEKEVLISLGVLEKQRVAYVNAQAGGYTNLIKSMAIANKMASDTALSPEDAKKLVEAEELTNYEKELAELKRQTYIAALNESDAVKTLVGNYSTMDSVQIGVLANQQKLLEIAKELSEEAQKQKSPLVDFSNVDFSVFGDFGNPFQSALDGMNALIQATMSGGEQIKKLTEEINTAKLMGLDTADREFELNLLTQKQAKDKKNATDKAITSGLSLTKSLFKEESKGYKVVSGLEKAYQASKIAFAIWEKKDTIKTLAIKVAGYAKDMVTFIGSVGAKIAAQMGLNVAQAQGAVASAAQAPPPVGFASAAAMIALLAGIGIAISGGGGSSYVDTSNQGTGTVFGDSEAKSASIANSIDILSENSDLMLPLTSAMLRSLKNIESNIGGLTNLVIRTGVGKDFSNVEGFKMNAVGSGISETFNTINDLTFGAADFLTLGLFSAVGDLLGGLFGTKTTVKGQGLYGADQSLGSILENGFSLQEYVDVNTKKKTLGVTTSNKNSTILSAADQQLANQFTLIFEGFYDTILSATDILGADLSTVQTNLENAVISIGKIDLKDLSSEEIQEKLEAVFGAAADSLAKQAFDGLDDFQKVGEGYYETLMKVASAVEEATYYTDRLNVTAIDYNKIVNKQADDLAAEIIRQSYLAKSGISTIKGGMTDLVNSFDGSAEEITDFISTLEDLQDQLFVTGKSGDYLTSTMILGAGGLDSLASGLDAYFEMLSPAEQAAELTRRLTNEFAIFGKELPSDVKAFRNLVSSIDITTASGQKLYGQIIALAPEFNDLQDALDRANSEVNALVQSLRDLAEQARAARGETEQPRNLAYLRNEFNKASELALQGDTEAANRLIPIGKDLMSMSKLYSVSGSDYAKDLAFIQGVATAVADLQESGLGTSISSDLKPSTGTGTTTPTIATTNSTMTTELQGMREELNAGLFAIAKFVQNVDSRTERWDDGNRVMVGYQPENGDAPIPVVVTP